MLIKSIYQIIKNDDYFCYSYSDSIIGESIICDSTKYATKDKVIKD